MLLLWLVSAVLLLVLVRALSPGEVGGIMRSADPWLLSWAVVLVAASTVLGAFNSFMLVTIRHHIGFVAYLKLFWMAWAVGLVLPGQVGDMGVLSWMMKKEGMRWTHSLGRLFVDKLISLGVIASFAAWGLLAVLHRLEFAGNNLRWGLAAALLAALAAGLAWRSPRARRWLQHVLDVMEESLRVTREHPWRVLANLLLTVVKVLVLSAAFWLICRAAGMATLTFPLLVQLMALGSLVAYLPLSMNGVGTVELAAIALFSLYGFDSKAVLAAYLMTRVLILLLAWLPCLPLLLLQFAAAARARR